jgi:2-polyprenyl-6-methoxyphenol hydroxylase-like FAD-dependent oxidoreductase
MAGLLLARAGVHVLVLEKHRDFFRDFRGDTIHPSTLELMHELGVLEEFLRLPHQEVRHIEAHFGNEVVHIADFAHLPTRCQFIAFMPQWHFLNFLATQARRYPTFELRMETEVTGLLWDGRRASGVAARTPQGELTVQADLVIGADGRGSTLRKSAGLEVVDLGVPIDVLWFRFSKKSSDPGQSFGFVGTGQFMVLLDRDEYWQCAYVIRKGSVEERQARGLAAFREEVGRCTGFLRDRTGELKDWDEVKLLTVKLDHLRQWFCEGLLCIGDSAHAMSPVGGVGINLAIQDAVATANLLAAKLCSGRVTADDLRAGFSARAFPETDLRRDRAGRASPAREAL